jgi:hypothetical protein
MSALGQTRSSRHVCVTSGLPLIADMRRTGLDVGFVPKPVVSRCSNCVCAKDCYSITSSAMASNDAGTVRESILAVWALITSSNWVDCTTGRSAGLAPLRMRPA